MFRASCANASTIGVGGGKQSEANLYATQHALRYIGAYVVVHSCDIDPVRKNLKSSKVFCLGRPLGSVLEV